MTSSRSQLSFSPSTSTVCDPKLLNKPSSSSLSQYRPTNIPPFRGGKSISKSSSHHKLKNKHSLTLPAPQSCYSIPTSMDSEAGVSVSQLPLPVDESTALLGDATPRKKPFYRARPLWLVPFALLAAITRGMTIAPRVEVFTQLSCNRIYGHNHEYNHTIALPFSQVQHLDPLGGSPTTVFFALEDNGDDDDTEDPRQLPSSRCTSDPAVQAGAARLQTIMTTTMGLLSALTTGWWGHFGERHGRTRVLATATAGMFLTDLTFILVSTPTSPLSKHGHILLLVSPLIEGLLGGWSTLSSTISAYVSDCTSSGSRAHIFSRFAGLLYLGASLGPALSGWVIQHPIAFPGVDVHGNGKKSVTSVFWIAIAVSVLNFLLVLFVFPESLGEERREKAMEVYVGSKAPREGEEEGEERERKGIVSQFLTPLKVFLPVRVMNPAGGRMKRDWSLTILAGALFGYLLSAGIYQLKYLYAEHIYGWEAEQLSYYISFISGARATFLLFFLPTIISIFKPKPKSSKKGKSKASTTSAAPTLTGGKKPKSTRAQLGHEIAFDLLLTRCSLFIDIISNILVCLAPAPTYVAHSNTNANVNMVLPPKHAPGMSQSASQALFVVATSLSSLGGGCMPAIQSLALCITQLRSLSDEQEGEVGTGALFGALAVLQATGSMIIGPMVFGLIYSGTVATFPKTIFVVCGAILFVSLMAVLVVRNPVREHGSGAAALGQRKKRKGREQERGRSRVSKDLRGGAVPVPFYDELGVEVRYQYGSVSGRSEVGTSSLDD